jgi:hypothetical protein
MYDGILASLQGSEERVARHLSFDPLGLRIPITADDVGYAVEEIYRGRSVVSGLASRLALCRWRKPEGNFIDTSVKGQKSSNVQVGELVCMTKDEVAQHEKLVLKGDKTPEEVYDAKVVKLVEERMVEEAKYRDQR